MFMLTPSNKGVQLISFARQCYLTGEGKLIIRFLTILWYVRNTFE